MNIKSATFVKGIVGEDEILENGIPQVAFIGRSNVGKSSVINTLANQKDLARTSAFPGRTQEINLFLINKSFYLVDLPGYGYAKASAALRDRLSQLINWYLMESHYVQKKVVLIIDAKVGVTQSDLDMLEALDSRDKDIIIVANKIDKVKNSEQVRNIKMIQEAVGGHKVIPYSAETKFGVGALVNEIVG